MATRGRRGDQSLSWRQIFSGRVPQACTRVRRAMLAALWRAAYRIRYPRWHTI